MDTTVYQLCRPDKRCHIFCTYERLVEMARDCPYCSSVHQQNPFSIGKFSIVTDWKTPKYHIMGHSSQSSDAVKLLIKCIGPISYKVEITPPSGCFYKQREGVKSFLSIDRILPNSAAPNNLTKLETLVDRDLRTHYTMMPWRRPEIQANSPAFEVRTQEFAYNYRVPVTNGYKGI